MTVLLLAEHDNVVLNGATAKALSAAKALGPVHVLVAGSGCAAVAAAAARLDGVDKVLLADSPTLAGALAEEQAALIVPLMASYGAFISLTGFYCHGPKGIMKFNPMVGGSRHRFPFINQEGWGTWSKEGANERTSFAWKNGELQ